MFYAIFSIFMHAVSIHLFPLLISFIMVCLLLVTVNSFMRIIIVVIISSIGSSGSIIIIIFTSSLLVTVTGPSVDFFNFWALDCLPPDSRAPRNWKILPTNQLLWLHHHPQPQYQCHTPLCLFSAFYLRPSSSKNTSVRRRSGRPSVRPSVCLSVTPFTMFLSSYHHWQKWCPCKRSRSEIKDQCIRVKTTFVPVWTFPDRNSRLDLQMATKRCTKLEVAQKRCPVVFRDHPSNFKVTGDKKTPIWSKIGCFQTVTRVFFKPMFVKWCT